MPLKFISESPLLSNYVEFENDAIVGQDKGVLEFNDPYLIGSVYNVDYSGNDVSGNPIVGGTIPIDTAQIINPTKVAWWLLGQLQDLICKDCEMP